MTDEFRPLNQETDPRYNAEPGLVLIPGSNAQKEYAKFEQFHSKYTSAQFGPGNPYTYRPYPKMLYRAEHWNGKRACMAAPPDPTLFRDPREFERAQLAAEAFTARCQSIVNNEEERQRAMENGWRESPQEAVDYLKARDDGKFTAVGERNYEDRNMSDAAKREIREAEAAHDGHLTEVPVKPLDRMAKARAAKAAKAAAKA